jgi:16S rRNA U516 pseudouridylate synthase RsuA-like enzyme
VRKAFWENYVDIEMIPFQKIAQTAGFHTWGEVKRDPNTGNVWEYNTTLLSIAMREGDAPRQELGEIKVDDVQYASPTDKKQVGIEIHSGKNRIVRRIFESLGYRVQKLDRVQFAGLTKKNLKRGDWRYLTEEEVDRLRMGAYE